MAGLLQSQCPLMIFVTSTSADSKLGRFCAGSLVSVLIFMRCGTWSISRFESFCLLVKSEKFSHSLSQSVNSSLRHADSAQVKRPKPILKSKCLETIPNLSLIVDFPDHAMQVSCDKCWTNSKRGVTPKCDIQWLATRPSVSSALTTATRCRCPSCLSSLKIE